MGLLTDLLKEAPLSAVLMEKVKTVEFERDEFKRQLDDCRRLYDVLQSENKNLSALLAEEVLLHGGACCFKAAEPPEINGCRSVWFVVYR